MPTSLATLPLGRRRTTKLLGVDIAPIEFPWRIERLEAVGDELHVYGPDEQVMVVHSHDFELLNWPQLDLPAPDLPTERS